MGSHRVALVASSFHPHSGGVEEHVRRVAGALVARGHDVVVWTVDRGEHLGVQRVDGIEVRYLPTPLPARSITSLARFAVRAPGAVASWVRAFRSFRPEVLHVHCFGPNGLYAYVLSAMSRTPLIVSAHGETFADDRRIFDRSALSRWGLRRALTSAARVTACSGFALADLKRFGMRHGTVIGNGVDPITPVLVERRDDPPVVLAVGRLERTKGFDLLIKAFDEGGFASSAKLVIVGSGSALADLMDDVSARGLSDVVTFTGQLDGAQVAEWMARACLVVVPSRMEAFGIVALEAWRAGTPLVMTNRGGPVEFVHNEVDGLLVDPEDTGVLAAAIGRVLGDATFAQSLAQEGRKSVGDFSWERVAERYAALVDEVVA